MHTCLESWTIKDNNIGNFQKINFIIIRKIKFSKILVNLVKNQETSTVLRLDVFGIVKNRRQRLEIYKIFTRCEK